MKQNLKLNISLNPVVTFDKETNLWVAKLPELPITAFDETEDKAIYRLMSLFEIFIKEQKEIVFERIIRKHLEKAIKEKPTFQIIRTHSIDSNNQEQTQLQMVS